MGTDVHVIDIDLLLHFVVDNVDHNSDTIDGQITFRGIDIIACVTNATENVGFNQQDDYRKQ